MKEENLFNIHSSVRDMKGSVIVIKYGGNAMKDESKMKRVIKDISLVKKLGLNPIVVHGGGPRIAEKLFEAGEEFGFVKGNRVTTKSTIKIVKEALEEINEEIKKLFLKEGVKVKGLTVKDKVIYAKKKYIYEGNRCIDIGYVGSVYKVDKEYLKKIIDTGAIPIIAPMGVDGEGNIYNINADYVAGDIAKSIEAKETIFMTNKDGIYIDIEDEGTLIDKLTVDSAKKLIEKNLIYEGMLPKVEACISAVDGRDTKAYILNGEKKHSILMSLFTKSGRETVIEWGNKTC